MVNPAAGRFDEAVVEKAVSAIRRENGQYTIIKTDSPGRSMAMLRGLLGLRRSRKPLPPPVARRGKVTGIVVCGGDGTFNLTARAAMQAGIPVGILPMGEANNIARSLIGTEEPRVQPVLAGNYRKIDVGRAGRLFFFGSIGFGFIPRLSEELHAHRRPLFGFSWSKLGGRVAAEVELKQMVVKIDAFRFELNPLMLNVNILPWSGGLKLSPVSIADDGFAEVIFDRGRQMGEFSTFTRLIAKEKYLYGEDIQLYRGRVIEVQPGSARRMYIDGEIVEAPSEVLPIEIHEKKLKVFC